MSENHMREAILVAARDLFYEKGIKGTSMRDIAGQVGIVQSSLYNHFRAKEDLVRAVMERSFQLVDDEVRSVFEAEPPSLDLLRKVLYAHAMQHVHGIKETSVFQLERRYMTPSVR
ncbi:MAG: TetR/AcrR family transcriptional regulator, partial [Dehalococcoidia bacterium]|nr:TetR/AcrR family transcriptional regulator [Dehalococcoidia bacterium]